MLHRLIASPRKLEVHTVDLAAQPAVVARDTLRPAKASEMNATAGAPTNSLSD